MRIANGKVEEIFLDDSVRIHCPPDLTPSPGQYLLAHANASDSPLPVPIFFSTDITPNGFRSAPIKTNWQPGESLVLRGPIGHGFNIPASAQKIALIAFEKSIACLHGLISKALKQNAEIVLLCDSQPTHVPEIIEVQSLKSVPDILKWADYAAIDIARENMNQLKEMLGKQDESKVKYEAQILIHAPMPCGGVAECGVCALTIRHEWKMICKEGPVFEFDEI